MALVLSAKVQTYSARLGTALQARDMLVWLPVAAISYTAKRPLVPIDVVGKVMDVEPDTTHAADHYRAVTTRTNAHRQPPRFQFLRQCNFVGSTRAYRSARGPTNGCGIGGISRRGQEVPCVISLLAWQFVQSPTGRRSHRPQAGSAYFYRIHNIKGRHVHVLPLPLHVLQMEAVGYLLVVGVVALAVDANATSETSAVLRD